MKFDPVIFRRVFATVLGELDGLTSAAAKANEGVIEMKKRLLGFVAIVRAFLAVSAGNNTAATGSTPLAVRRAFVRRAGRVFAASFLGVLATGGQAVMAADRYVATTGNDVANNCTNSVTPCMTIQHAIDVASSNDIIHVAGGAYSELASGPLTVNKTLTLLGAQNGVDARGRIAAESSVTDSQGTYVTANNVVIDGFTFENSTNGAFTGYGLLMGAGTTGTQILNNIIQNNIIGIGLGASQAVIWHNQVQNNNQPGPASGSGIYTDQFVSGGPVSNVLIQENAFVGNNDAGIDVSNTALPGVSNLNVSTNSFDLNGRAVLLFNTHMSSVNNNSITNTTSAPSAAIRLFDNNSNLGIMFNNLINGAGHAIRLSVLGFVGGPSSNVVINYNNIGTVGSASFLGDGLLVDSGSHVGTLDAQCNWWGSSTGPTNMSNPGGTGEEVLGNADFTPWFSAPIPVGACIGGAPTPGKATGGGQIDSDPVFSPLGDLLSLPALIPSLANPNAQATFGFVAMCCPAKGNLEYNDHQADVRIKAQSVDGLNISSPGTSCPTTPGSHHATFTGTAAVIRSTGSTTEPFTVDVDDCGEPGTMDTFGIKTTTYMNGPSPLIGGNIKIH